MENKKLFLIGLRNISNGRTHGESLWIVATNSEVAIRKAIRYGNRKYGCRQEVYNFEAHGTVDVL